jgi:putative membrane protein
MQRLILQKIGIFLRGFAMGCADLVPGVSGGTIALITNIYERVITAITHIDLNALKLVFQGQVGAAWRYLDGSFLVVLLAGMLTAIFTLANSIAWLLEYQPLLVWSFFSGLILASAIYLLTRLEGRKSLVYAGFLLLGVALVIALGFLRADFGNPSLWIVFGAGFVAISAMMLPGISGSFILLMLGLYQPTLEAVRGFELGYLFCFALGAGCGFLVFSRLIKWMLERFHQQTLMFLVGLLLGSLYSTWPWKTLENDSSVYHNLWPGNYADLYGSAHLGLAVAVALAAALLVWGLEVLGRHREPMDEQY